jgi:hypothetical protein
MVARAAENSASRMRWGSSSLGASSSGGSIPSGMANNAALRSPDSGSSSSSIRVCTPARSFSHEASGVSVSISSNSSRRTSTRAR